MSTRINKNKNKTRATSEKPVEVSEQDETSRGEEFSTPVEDVDDPSDGEEKPAVAITGGLQPLVSNTRGSEPPALGISGTERAAGGLQSLVSNTRGLDPSALAAGGLQPLVSNTRGLEPPALTAGGLQSLVSNTSGLEPPAIAAEGLQSLVSNTKGLEPTAARLRRGGRSVSRRGAGPAQADVDAEAELPAEGGRDPRGGGTLDRGRPQRSDGGGGGVVEQKGGGIAAEDVAALRTQMEQLMLMVETQQATMASLESARREERGDARVDRRAV